MDNIVGVEYMLYNGTIVHGKKGSDLLWAAQVSDPMGKEYILEDFEVTSTNPALLHRELVPRSV